MLRRNRKFGRYDVGVTTPSPSAANSLPTLPQQKRRRPRRKRRSNRDKKKVFWNLLLGAMICILLVFAILHVVSENMWTANHPTKSNRRILRSHPYDKRTSHSSLSVSHLQKTFNQSVDCSLEPTLGYPIEFNLLRMLEAWPIDDISHLEDRHDTASYQSLCVFDWNKADDREKMEHYRNMELPFILTGDPQVVEAVHRWNQPGYLVDMLGPDTKYTTDYSSTNHYIYVNKIQKARYRGGNQRMRKGHARPDGKEPYEADNTTINRKIQMTYLEWLAIAHANKNGTADTSSDAHTPPNTEKPHWYFQFMTCGTYDKGECKSTANVTTPRLATLGSELPFLSDPKSFYIVEPEQQKGRIQCKFGMAGITSQAHFDSPRNFLVLLGGKKRYVLLHPRNYANLYMFPGNHPSARHSAVNWSAPDLTKHPMFAEARATEAVLKKGEVLYIPPKWIHSIVSLSTSMQCNAWSGSKN